MAYRSGHKGPLVHQAVLLPVWRWETDHERGAAAQALHLLISREPDATQVKYSRCYGPPGAPALRVGQALYRQMQRSGLSACFKKPSSNWACTRTKPVPGPPGSTTWP